MILPALYSSFIEVVLTQPLDVIKTHYQSKTPIRYNIKNLYKGLLPRAIGNIPSRSVFLLSQEYLQKYLQKYKLIYPNLFVPIGAGFTQTLVDTPFEVLKINKINNINNKNLYKGFVPHLSRNIIFLISVYNFKKINKTNNKLYTGLLGAMGGVFGAYISHPLDTIKTRIQSNQKISYNFKDLMKGCHLRSSISLINMFISITMFEIFKNNDF
jgi:hypothetical protein